MAKPMANGEPACLLFSTFFLYLFMCPNPFSNTAFCDSLPKFKEAADEN